MPTSAFGSDSPDFLDTGDPELGLPVPKLRGCFRVMDFASDIDPGPDLSVGEISRSLDRPSGALVPAIRPLLVEACCSGLLCRGLLGLRCSVISCMDPPTCHPPFRFGRTGGI